LYLRVDALMHSGEKIPRVAPTDRLQSVLLEMTRKRLGLAVVMEGDQIAGVITDGDLRRAFQLKGMQEDLSARDLMTSTPKRLPQTALAVDARELMERNTIQQLLIEDDHGRLVGVVHLHDLLRAKVV